MVQNVALRGVKVEMKRLFNISEIIYDKKFAFSNQKVIFNFNSGVGTGIEFYILEGKMICV